MHKRAHSRCKNLSNSRIKTNKENKRAKRPLNNNQTQAQANQTKEKYHRFLHRGKPHEKPLSTLYEKSLLIHSCDQPLIFFFSIKTNDDENSSAQFQSNSETPTECWSLVRFLPETLIFFFLLFFHLSRNIHHLINTQVHLCLIIILAYCIATV